LNSAIGKWHEGSWGFHGRVPKLELGNQHRVLFFLRCAVAPLRETFFWLLWQWSDICGLGMRLCEGSFLHGKAPQGF